MAHMSSRRLLDQISFSKRLPESVFLELIDILYGNPFPIALVGLALTSVGTLLALRLGDMVLFVLAFIMVLSTIGPVLNIRAYHRLDTKLKDRESAELWERRYLLGSSVFALLLGTLSARTIMFGDPLSTMLVTANIYGYGASIVIRQAVRPSMCMVSLVLAVVPTIVAFAVYITVNKHDTYTMLAYALQALLIVGFVVSSLQMAFHIYRTALQQLVAKHDLIILAGQDPLTGLPNRALLEARLAEALSQLGSGDELMACHYVDLDLFKGVNDRLGHHAGDAILKAVAERLSATLRVGDTAARIGGDEFVVLQVGVQSADEARLLARRIVRAISAPYLHDDEEIRIGASIGFALAPRDGSDLKQLTSCADAALYEAKRKGRGSVVMWGDQASSDAAISAA